MAISFIQQPNDSPLRIWDAYNDVIYVVESSLALAISARFAIEVNLGDVLTIVKPLDLTTKRACLNIKEVIRDYIISTFQTNNTLTRNISNVLTCRVVVSEFNANGEVIGTVGLSNYSYVLNTSQTFKEMYTSNFQNIDVSLNVTPSFLTDITTKNVFSTDKDSLSFYYGGGTYVPIEIVFKKYNSLNVLLSTNNITIGALAANNTFTFGSGPSNVKELFGASYLVGASYYTVQIDTTNAFHTYVLKDKCNDDENIQVSFLNRWGVYDSFTFDLKSEESSEIEKSTYQKNKGSFNGSTYSFGDGKETVATFSTTITNNLKCNSNWITDSESAWLKQLFTSPSIFVYRSGSYEAYTVSDKNYVNKKVINDWLFNYTIRLEKSDNDYRQK